MSGNKHEKRESPFPDDLERNPGIGQSKGTTVAGADPEEIAGENTIEGDVENDTTPTDGVRTTGDERTNA